MARITVVGAGALGCRTALEFATRKHKTTLVAERLPGEGISSDYAPGLGTLARHYSHEVTQHVLASREEWLELARDPTEIAVQPTRVREIVNGGPGEACYESFSFEPVAMCSVWLSRFQRLGGDIEQCSLLDYEVERIRRGSPLVMSDYTVLCVGLDVRDIRPDFLVYPTRQPQAVFPWEGGELPIVAPEADSRLDEKRAVYVARRPNSVVVGGSSHPHIGSTRGADCNALKDDVVRKANRRFGRYFQSEQATSAVSYIATRDEGMVREVGEKVAFLGAAGPLGFIAAPSIARTLAVEIEVRLNKQS